MFLFKRRRKERNVEKNNWLPNGKPNEKPTVKNRKPGKRGARTTPERIFRIRKKLHMSLGRNAYFSLPDDSVCIS